MAGVGGAARSIQEDVRTPVNKPATPAPVSSDEETCALVNSEALSKPIAEDLSAEPEIDVEAQGTTLPIGMKIDDRYEILGVLGVGGFATVYRAHHLTIDRDVALKVMDLKKGVDPSYSQRFFREAKIAAKIHHNNVVSIYDFGHVGETGQPYIAMEMLHGHDLSHELTEAGPLSPQRAFVLFRPVLDALAQGHRLGIVHKDLKPENLYLVDPQGQHELMKVLDFGVARINSNEVAKLTSAGQLLGTPRYLAPEYIKQQQVSPAIDVYQMALIISEALTGIPAVSGDPYHAMILHCSGQLQIAEYLLEGRVGEVFRKAIAINPEERYADCEAFGAALDEIQDYFSSTVPLKGGAPQLTPDGRTSSKMTVMPFSDGKTVSGKISQNGLDEDASTKKKSNVGMIVVGVLAILVASISGVVLLKQKAEPVEQPVVEPVVNEPPPDPVFKFTFETTPAGAKVLKNGKHTVCYRTPCDGEFKESELRVSPLIVFDLDGYEQKSLELSVSAFNENNGKISVELTEKEVEVTELEFTIEYTPANAVVVERASGNKICTASPCKYQFSIESGYVPVNIELAGYRTKQVDLTKKYHQEVNGHIVVTLEKETPKQKAQRPPQADTGSSKPAQQPVQQVQEQKQEPVKPKIKF